MTDEYKEYVVKIKKINIEQESNENEIQKRLELNRKEYLELFKKEYEFERLKKQSFENRAGIILTIISGIFTILIKDLEITKDFIEIFKNNLTMFLFIKFSNIISIHIFFGLTIYYLVKIINVQSHNNYGVNYEIDYTEPHTIILNDLLYNHKLIINSFRDNNEKKAKYFKQSLKYLIFTFIFLIFYSFLKEV